MIAKAPCPRCSRSVAVKAREPVLVPFRHKDNDGQWCSGTPKSVVELGYDLISSLRVEDKVIGEYLAELHRHIDECVRIADKLTDARNNTTVIVRQATDAINAEKAARA